MWQTRLARCPPATRRRSARRCRCRAAGLGAKPSLPRSASRRETVHANNIQGRLLSCFTVSLVPVRRVMACRAPHDCQVEHVRTTSVLSVALAKYTHECGLCFSKVGASSCLMILSMILQILQPWPGSYLNHSCGKVVFCYNEQMRFR